MKRSVFFLIGVFAVASTTSVPRAQQGRPAGSGQTEILAGTGLGPTNHPPLPRELSLVWLAPDRSATARVAANAGVASAARLYAGGDYSKAFAAAAEPSVQQGPLALYAAYYAGVSQLRLDKPADALRTFRWLRDQRPVGYLLEAAQLGEADASLKLDDPKSAVTVYEALLRDNPTSFDDILMRLGKAAKAAGDIDKAADAFGRVYYEFALGDFAASAGSELSSMNLRSVTAGSPRFNLELGRAERLFGAKQYPEARAAYSDLHSLASGGERELVQLRLAECDYHLKRFRIARDAVKPITEGRVSRQSEALFFYAVSARDSGDGGTFLTVVRRIADEFPSDKWAEEALNSLGTFYVRQDDDDRADAAFRELYEKFPQGSYAEHAAWKVGWRAYRQGQFADTIRFFESAATGFPRSDYRPSWLYWAGRAQEKVSNTVVANQRYATVVTDYMNSYYGRLAAARLGGPGVAVAQATRTTEPVGPRDIALPSSLPPNAAVIRALLGAEMLGDALNELRYARRTWGDSSAIQATVAWTNQQQSRTESGMTRFQLVRGAINTMRRAYPQFMTAGGDALPHDVLTVIYPVAYWDLIQHYSEVNRLDPYLVAALVAQESTFVADIRSHANAYGLMQLMPATAREYARKLKIPYSQRALTDPEANVRMGTAYFADKIRQFGDTHLALASYNAGETAVRRWQAERPGIDREEFIDDIPYQETQGYVRKILGTADDYRRLYGAGEARTAGVDKTPVADTASVAAPPPAPVVKRPALSAPSPARKAPLVSTPKKAVRPAVRQTSRATPRPKPRVAPTPPKKTTKSRKA